MSCTIIISDTEEEEEEEEEEETTLYYEVNVFPSPEWTRFSIIEQDSEMGEINVIEIYEYAKRIVIELGGGTNDIDILFGAEVVHTTLRERKHKEIKKLAGAPYSEYGKFFDKQLSDALLKRVNNLDGKGRNWPYVVRINDEVKGKSFVGARVSLFPAVRDVARHFYRAPTKLPRSLDYEITIYRDSDKELSDLDRYTKMVSKHNSGLPSPLSLPVAMDKGEFPALSRVIFVARRADEIIGYCGCTVLPYRIDTARQFDRAITAAMEKAEVTDQEGVLPILERFFMGVAPHSLFEIEALSASPFEAANNLGLALIYEAMRFIRDPVMHRFYPVSHVVSQAASYITKLYLSRNFHFRYHGSNHFMNEGFVEIIDTTSKSMLVSALTQLLGHYDQFLGGLGLSNSFGDQKDTQMPAITTMMDNVIKLYQLYYLLIKWDRPSPAYTTTNVDTLDMLIALFEKLFNALPSDAFSVYFAKAYRRVKKYRDDPHVGTLGGIEETIVWNDGTPPLFDEDGYQLPPEYGFMLVPIRSSTRKEKHPYVAGYDVIYGVIPNMLEISASLINKKIEEEVKGIKATLSNAILTPINILVRRDLARPHDYELPVIQLEDIGKTLLVMTTKKKKSMTREKETLEALSTEVAAKIVLRDKNVDFSTTFTGLYNAKGSVDCFISFALLVEEWPATESEVSSKFVATQKRKLLLLPPRNEPLLLPKTKEHLFGQINTLYEIIWPNVEKETLVIYFNDSTYTIAALLAHFNTLKSMENSIDGMPVAVAVAVAVEEEEEEEMVVEGTIAGYKLEDFIDEEEEEEMDVIVRENVLNEALI